MCVNPLLGRLSDYYVSEFKETVDPKESTPIFTKETVSTSLTSVDLTSSMETSFEIPSTSVTSSDLESTTLMSSDLESSFVTSSEIASRSRAAVTSELSSCLCTETQTVTTTSTVSCELATSSVTSSNSKETDTSTHTYGLTPNRPTINLQAIVKNLTIDVTRTSAYVRKLTSAEDTRQSSAVMGWVGVLSVAIPIVVILLSDLKLLRFHMRMRHAGYF